MVHKAEFKIKFKIKKGGRERALAFHTKRRQTIDHRHTIYPAPRHEKIIGNGYGYGRLWWSVNTNSSR